MIPFYRVPVYQSVAIGQLDQFDPIMSVPMYITFTPELVEFDANLNYVYRFRCQDCYAASGNPEAFTTSAHRVKDMPKDHAHPDQEQEMNEHGRQHGIMWAWARSIK